MPELPLVSMVFMSGHLVPARLVLGGLLIDLNLVWNQKQLQYLLAEQIEYHYDTHIPPLRTDSKQLQI